MGWGWLSLGAVKCIIADKIMDAIRECCAGGHWYMCDAQGARTTNAGAIRAWLKGEPS